MFYRDTFKCSKREHFVTKTLHKTFSIKTGTRRNKNCVLCCGIKNISYNPVSCVHFIFMTKVYYILLVHTDERKANTYIYYYVCSRSMLLGFIYVKVIKVKIL